MGHASSPTFSDQPSRSATIDSLARHVRRHAGDYFPDIDSGRVTVGLRSHAERFNSQLYEFQLKCDDVSHRLYVKIPFAPKHLSQHSADGIAVDDRPRLFPKAAAQIKGLYEFNAMTAIQDHFTALNDDRYGVIRVLDLLQDPFTLVMEKGRDPSFQKGFISTHRLRRPSKHIDMAIAMRNAGGWLRRFHEITPLEHTKTRNDYLADFLDSADRLTSFLNDSRHRFGQTARDRLMSAAREVLPARLPLGLIHGDYAPRNILLGSSGRITVFDTLARWQAPIYEDIAHFLIAIKASAPQICSAGTLYRRNWLACCEGEFLQGYFGQDEIPLKAIRLFECILVIEWWASLVYRHEEAAGVRRLAKRMRLSVYSRYLAGYVRSVLREVENNA